MCVCDEEASSFVGCLARAMVVGSSFSCSAPRCAGSQSYIRAHTNGQELSMSECYVCKHCHTCNKDTCRRFGNGMVFAQDL